MYYAGNQPVNQELFQSFTWLVELSEKGDEKKEDMICITLVHTYSSSTFSCRVDGLPLFDTCRKWRGWLGKMLYVNRQTGE